MYGLIGTGFSIIGRSLIAPYRFKNCDNLQIPYISYQVCCAMELSKPQLISTCLNMDSGEVATNFHSVKIRVKGTPSELVVNNSQQSEEMQQQLAGSRDRLKGNPRLAHFSGQVADIVGWRRW